MGNATMQRDVSSLRGEPRTSRRPSSFVASPTVTINFAKGKLVTEGGERWLVAPMTMIVTPSVLSGSKGPLAYLSEDTSAAVNDWDRRPITMFHPTSPLDGSHLSANDEGVLDRQGIGEVREPKFVCPVGGGKCRLGANAWMRVSRLQVVPHGKDVYQRVLAGQPLEISTGLFTTNMPAPPGANINGTPFDYYAREHQADHLAVLPEGQKGACGINDSCGLNVVNRLVVNVSTVNACSDCSDAKPCAKCQKLAHNDGDSPAISAPSGGSVGASGDAGVANDDEEDTEEVENSKDRSKPSDDPHPKLSPYDVDLGSDAARQKKMGSNPPSWAVDEDKWEKAKTAADKGDYTGDSHWAVVSHIYQNMGGTIKGKADKKKVDNMVVTPVENAWSDAAREAAAAARKAGLHASEETEKNQDVDAGIKGQGTYGSRARPGWAAGASSKEAKRYADTAENYHKLGDHDSAEVYHRLAAVSHETAATYHKAYGAGGLAQKHLAAAYAHRNAAKQITSNATPAQEGLHGMDGDLNADDYRHNTPTTTSVYQWADDSAEPLGDEDQQVGQGDRPPDPGKLARITGKSKKQEVHRPLPNLDNNSAATNGKVCNCNAPMTNSKGMCVNCGMAVRNGRVENTWSDAARAAAAEALKAKTYKEAEAGVDKVAKSLNDGTSLMSRQMSMPTKEWEGREIEHHDLMGKVHQHAYELGVKEGLKSTHAKPRFEGDQMPPALSGPDVHRAAAMEHRITSATYKRPRTHPASYDDGVGFNQQTINDGVSPMPMGMQPGQQAPMPEHEASEHALGASAACDDCDEPMKHAQDAHEASEDGEHDDAAMAHLKAAKAHEEEDGDDHERAAMLHRKAASMHTLTQNQTTVTNQVSQGEPMTTQNQRVAVMTKLVQAGVIGAQEVGKKRVRNRFQVGRNILESGIALNDLAARKLLTNAKKKDEEMEDGDEDDEEMEDNEGSKSKAEGSNADVIGGTGTMQAGGKGTIDEYATPTKPGTAGNLPPKPTGNRLSKLMAVATPEEREVLHNAFEMTRQAKLQIVRRLVANAQNADHRKRMGDKFMVMSLPELQEMAALMPAPATENQYAQPLNTFGELPALMTGGDNGMALNASATGIPAGGFDVDDANAPLPPTFNARETMGSYRTQAQIDKFHGMLPK